MLEKLLHCPVIPVIVIDDANDAEPLAEALLAGGMDVIEITCRTGAAHEALRRIIKAFPEMLVGAGTVVSPEQASMCIDVGVSFGLAPGLNPSTVQDFEVGTVCRCMERSIDPAHCTPVVAGGGFDAAKGCGGGFEVGKGFYCFRDHRLKRVHVEVG